MSYKYIKKDGKTIKVWQSVEEDHPEAVVVDSKKSVFERAEDVTKDTTPEFIEVSVLKLMRECGSFTVTSEDGNITVEDADSENPKAVLSIDLADFIQNADKAKTVIVASDSEYNAALRGIQRDGVPVCNSAIFNRRAFLVSASGAKRLFDKVYVHNNFYSQSGTQEDFNYDAMGGKKEDFNDSYVCGVIRGTSSGMCVDAFLGLPQCNLDDITLEDGVVKLTFHKQFSGITTGYMYCHACLENTTVRVFLNPQDFKD